MPLQYVDAKPLNIQPLDIGLTDTILGRRQVRQDTAVAQREAALQEALSKGYLNQADRDIFEQQARQKFDDISTKYSGNLSAGYSAIQGAVTDVKSDPYHQANQRLLEEAQNERTRVNQLGANAYVAKSVMDERLYDDKGNLRDPNSFKSQVYDLQDFYKQGQLIGSEIAQSQMNSYKSILGGQYFEKQLGFRDTNESADYVGSAPGQQQITDILTARGVDPNDAKLRNTVGQAIINSSVGTSATMANRNFESDADKAAFAFSKQKHADALKNSNKNNKGTDDKTTEVQPGTYKIPVPSENIKMNELREKGQNYKYLLKKQDNMRTAASKLKDLSFKASKKSDPNELTIVKVADLVGTSLHNLYRNVPVARLTPQQLSDAQYEVESALNDENFQESIDNVANKSENYRQRFEDGKIVDVDNASGIFTIASDFISMITSPFKLMGSVLVMLGVPFVVISVVLGLLSITLILSMWRLLKTGD